MQKKMEEREVKVINKHSSLAEPRLSHEMRVWLHDTTNTHDFPWCHDFYFRQLRKVKVGDPVVGPEGRHSLLCTSNEFGLTFVGCGDGVRVFETSVLYLVDQDENIRGPRNAMADVSSLKATFIYTPAPPLHVSLSCDSLTLCVALRENSILKCLFFDTRALSRKGAPITPFASIDLTTHQVIHLTCLQWNPALPDTMAVSLSNALQLLVVKDDVVATVTKKLSANAICWSPKGKQLAVGLKDGSLVQLSSKDLEQKKAFNCPDDIFGGEAQQISDLHWISTYMFAVVYTPQSSTNSMPSFVFLSAPKGATPKFVNYEDVYYGTGTRQEKFYFTYISKWGVLISSSANAIDTAVFAQPDDKWEKWELEDTGRAEMPLDQDNNETFAAGMALDLTSQTDVAINESTSLPPSPLLLLYSDQGVLCPYTVINTGCPPSELKKLVTPSHPLPSGPVRQPPITTQDQNRPPQQPPASSQPLLDTLSQGFTPVSYTQPGSSSVPPPHISGPQLAITTASTARLGVSPLTMGGMTLGGNKLGSTTQPSYSQFSVSALTGGQPFRPPPPSYSRPQLQASSASPGFFLRPGAPVQRPTGAAPLLATAGSLTDSLSVTRGVQQSGQLPPPYVAPTTSVPQPQSAVHTPASQPAPNVSLPPMTMQPPRATRPLDQSFQLAGMPPLFSSTPLAPMGSRPPAAQASGVPLHMAAVRASTGLQSQQQSQPGIPPPSMVSPPTYPQPGVPPPSMVAPPSYPQPGVPPPSLVSPLTHPQPGVPPPSLVFPLTHPQPGVPPPSVVSPPTYPQPSIPPPSSVTPPTRPQLGVLPPSMVAPPTYPQPSIPPPSSVTPPTRPQLGVLPPSMVAPPTQPQLGVLPPSMVAPPTRPQPGIPSSLIVAPPTRLQPGLSPPTMVAPPTYPQPGVPHPSMVAPPTRPQPGLSPPTMVAPPTYPQPGVPHPSMVAPPTPPQPGLSPPSMVAPPTRPQPGLSPPSMVAPPTRLQPTAPPVPVSKQQPPPKAAQDDTEYGDHFEKIEASFSQSIQDEIEKFADGLESLKDELRDDFGEWEDVGREEVKVAELGSMEDLRQLCEEAQEMEEGIQDIVKATKELERSCDQLGDDTLRGYEISEEVKANLKKKNDPNYISLLKLRPLDAYNARNLNNIRSLFLQVKQTVEEVNSQLNAEMEKRYEERRQRGRSPMKAPSVQTIYSSLRTNRKIARMQSANIERITNNMKRLKLIPQSWHPADVVSATSPTSEKSFREASTSPGSLRQPDQELESPAWKTIPADKSETLRDYLSSIDHVPVIRVKSTRFVLSGRQSDHSSTSTPQESGHWDGTEIPYSYPDGPTSVVDSERGSTVDVQTPTSQQYGGLSGLSGSASMPAQPVVQLLSHSSLAQPSTSSLKSASQSTVDVLIDKDQQIKVLTLERNYIPTTSPSKYQQTPPSVAQSGTVHWGGSPSAQPRSEDHTPQPPAHFPLQHTISTTTYTSTAPLGLGVPSVQLKPSGHPSPPMGGAPSADRPHTVVWGGPSTAPIPNPQQPSFSVTTQPSLQLGGLRRAEPFSNLTKIQPSGGPGSSTSASNPLASTNLAQNMVVTKSETSKLLSTASTLSSTNAISTTNQVSSTFSFSIGATMPLTSMGFMPSGNPAMTIKPTAGLAGSTGPSGLNLFGATSSQVQQKASPTSETKPPGSSLSITGITTTTTNKTTSTATPSFSSLFANMPTFSTTTNFASHGGSSSTFPFQFGLKTQPTADAATEKTAPGIASSGVTKTDSKPPPTETKFGPIPSKDFLGSLLSQTLSSSVKTGSSPSASVGSTAKASAATTTAGSTDYVFGSMSTSSLKLSSLSSVSLKAPVAPVLPTSKAAPGKEEDSGGESQETESEALKDMSPVNENPQDIEEPDVRAPPDQLGPLTGLHKMSSETDPSRSTSLVNKPLSGLGTIDKSPLVSVSRGERKTDSEDGEVVKDEEDAAEQITPEQTETEITLQPLAEQATKKGNQVSLPLLQTARTQTTTKNEPPEHGDDNSTSIKIPTSSQPSTLPPPSMTKDSPLLPSSSLTSLTMTSPADTPGTNTSASVSTATAAAIQVATHAATDKTIDSTEKKAELKKTPSISQEPAKNGDKAELSQVSTPATQQTQMSGPGESSGIEIKQPQTGGSLSLLGRPLSGSQGSLQSAGGDEQEMEEMAGDMENEMEPIEMNSSQQQPQQSTGGLFTLNSFGGLGGKASNPTANPFGSLHSSSSSSTTSTSAFQSSGRSGILKPPSGSFSTPSQQPPMLGMGVGIGRTSSQGGTSSVMERPHLQGSSFGGGPVFGSSPSPAAFGSPPLFGTTLSANGMQGRIFGAGSNAGTGGLFQQSGNANELSFDSLARQPSQNSSQGFGAGAGTGFGGPTPMSGQPQFSAWRK